MFLIKDFNEFYLIDIDNELATIDWYDTIQECVRADMDNKSYKTWESLSLFENRKTKIEYLKKYYDIVAEITKEENPEYWL